MFNHAFTIAFEVKTPNEGKDVTSKELLDALEARLESLRQNGDEIIEATGMPYDTYVVETGESVEAHGDMV